MGSLEDILEPSWPSWSHLGPSWRHLKAILAVLEAILAVLEASWRPSWSRLGQEIGELRSLAIPAGRAEAHWGGLLGKEPKPKPKKSSTPGTPVINQQGAADRRRLRRVTAAPCLFGNAYVAESWARAWPSYRTMCSPNRFGKPSGNTWRRTGKRRRVRKKESGQAIGPCVPPAVVETLRGTRGGGKRKKRRRERRRRRRRRRLLGSLLGHSWGLLGASCGPLGGFLRVSLGFLGVFGGFLGVSLAVFGRSWPVRRRRKTSLGPLWDDLEPLGALQGCLGGNLGRLGGLLGRLWALLGPSWGPLGPSWGSLGGFLGALGAILMASWAVLSRRKAEKEQTPKSFKNIWKINDFGICGPSWRSSWRPLGPSWRPLGGVLGGLGPS